MDKCRYMEMEPLPQNMTGDFQSTERVWNNKDTVRSLVLDFPNWIINEKNAKS